MLSMIFLLVSIISLSVQQANCRTIIETLTTTTSPKEAADFSQPCSIEMEQACKESENYSLKIDTTDYLNSGRMKVKVFMTQCPQYGSVSPWWYKISLTEKRSSVDPVTGSGRAYLGETVVENDAEKKVELVEDADDDDDDNSKSGKFEIPRRRYEVNLCDSDSSVVFTSCSPKPLDLPVQYVWRATRMYHKNDILCFRVTLQLEEDTCEQKEVCILMADLLDSANHGEKSLNSTDDGYQYYLPQPSFTILNPRVDKSDVSIDINELDTDSQEGGVTIPASNGCFIARDYYVMSNFPWVPDCDCEGNYKTIQCNDNDGTLQCWCSTRSGSEINLTRRDLNCTDPMEFEFRC